MGLPGRNAPTDEIILYLQEKNAEIHNTILEKGDYMSLINVMVKDNIADTCNNIQNALTAIHVSKIRYYANTRDVTYEFLHVLCDAEPNTELSQALEDADLTLLGIQENVDLYCNRPFTNRDIPEIVYLNEIWNRDIFEYDDSLGYGRNFQNLRTKILKLEELYLNTTHSMYLPIIMLDKKERETLKNTDDTKELEALLRKIVENWGMVNTKASIHAKNRVATATAQRGSKYNMNYHLETMGIYRKQYYRFLTNEHYSLPGRQTVFGMGLYLIPGVTEFIESFMELFGYSLDSPIATVADSETSHTHLTGGQIISYLNAGLDTDIIRYLVEQNSEPISKSSTRTFS